MKPVINFMGIRHVAFAVTVLLTLISLGSLAVKGLNFGLDFTGGTLIEFAYEKPADLNKVREQLRGAGYEDAVVQSFGATTDVVVRMQGDDPDLGHKVATALQQSGDALQVKKVEFVGPQVGEELRDQGGLAMLLALGGILLYLAFRFQWKFAVGAILTLVLDVVLTLGVFAITGLDFSLTAIAALLTLVGYSVNDKVVVYDRMRENLRSLRKQPLREVIDMSINQTLTRSLYTSVTAFLAVLPLAVWGGSAVASFAVPMAFGVCIAAFSSVFIAAPILLYLGDWRGRRGIAMKPTPTPAKPASRSATNKPNKTTRAKKLFSAKPLIPFRTTGKVIGVTTAVPMPMATKKNPACNLLPPIAACTSI